MSDIKDIFKDYREEPSEEVWRKLNERLEAEMPAQVVRRLRKVSWAWGAAAVTALLIGGVVFSVLHKPTDQNGATAQVESVQEVAVDQETDVDCVAVAENPAEEAPTAIECAEVAQPAPARMPEPETVSEEETPPAAQGSKVRQIVLPANSTLARQLEEDPVLKTLSPDAVDWSLPVHLSIPNLFTPNADGVNDFFVIDGLENYTSPKLTVRDKHNRVVFQSSAYANSWGGENCPDGVYMYELTFTCNGIENMATGKVRIIRS